MDSLTLTYILAFTCCIVVIICITSTIHHRKVLSLRQEHYRNLAEASFEAILLSRDGIIYDCNQRTTEITGYSRQELIGKFIYELVSPTFKNIVQAHVTSGFDQPYEIEGIFKEGKNCTIEVRGRTFQSNGHTMRASSIRDVTARKAEETQLRKLFAAVEHSPASIVITDLDANIEYVNPAFSRLTGYSLEEALGKNPRILKAGDQSDEFYKELWDTLIKGEEWRGEFHNKRKDGTLFWEMASISPIFDSHGNISHFVAIKEDFTERKEMQDKLEQMAQFDMLTGLPNRRMFLDRLVQTVALAQRNNQRFALLFVDLDGFKLINDKHGHEAGDRVLKTVAARLSACVRISDTVGRIGGDEFTIILGSLTNYNDAGQVAEKILSAMKRPISLPDGGTDFIGASIGISVFPEDAQDGNGLIVAADNAMYEVKRSGKNSYRFFKGQSDLNTEFRPVSVV